MTFFEAFSDELAKMASGYVPEKRRRLSREDLITTLGIGSLTGAITGGLVSTVKMPFMYASAPKGSLTASKMGRLISSRVLAGVGAGVTGGLVGREIRTEVRKRKRRKRSVKRL